MDLFFGIIDGLFQATPEILAEVIALIPEITAALIGEIPKLVQAAFELLTGLARGLIDNAPRVIGNAMSSVGETVVNGFKDFLGIQSPSKVFMGLGGDVVDGLKQGLGDGERLLASASVDMAQNLKVSSENVLTGRSNLPISTGTQTATAPSTAGISSTPSRTGTPISASGTPTRKTAITTGTPKVRCGL